MVVVAREEGMECPHGREGCIPEEVVGVDLEDGAGGMKISVYVCSQEGDLDKIGICIQVSGAAREQEVFKGPSLSARFVVFGTVYTVVGIGE